MLYLPLFNYLVEIRNNPKNGTVRFAELSNTPDVSTRLECLPPTSYLLIRTQTDHVYLDLSRYFRK